MEISYNRQVNKPGYVWGIFQLYDALILSVGTIFTMGFVDSIPVTFGFYLGFVFYTLIFRFNKPLGYDKHLFKSLITPSIMRPGHQELKPYVQPTEDIPHVAFEDIEAFKARVKKEFAQAETGESEDEEDTQTQADEAI